MHITFRHQLFYFENRLALCKQAALMFALCSITGALGLTMALDIWVAWWFVFMLVLCIGFEWYAVWNGLWYRMAICEVRKGHEEFERYAARWRSEEVDRTDRNGDR